jgi:hypothetical protein
VIVIGPTDGLFSSARGGELVTQYLHDRLMSFVLVLKN